MNYNFKIDYVLVTIIGMLCLMLLYNVLRKLRSSFPYRVNCWFCNSNFWIKFPDRNSWTCHNCDQYNGFTKDGDYNKPILASPNTLLKSPKNGWRKTILPLNNGLCKMCNVNQQLKVTQLANFVPMNEKSFDHEIQTYSNQLEKAYRLCSPCRKVVQLKLHKEKEHLLGAKLLQIRTPERKIKVKQVRFNRLKKFITYASIYIGRILFLFVLAETIRTAMISKSVQSTIKNNLEMVYGLTERLLSVGQAKVYMTFPMIENYVNYMYDTINLDFNNIDVNKFNGGFNNLRNQSFGITNDVGQKVLSGTGCALQIIGHLLDMYTLKHAFIFDIMWTTCVFCAAQSIVTSHQLLICFIKMTCIFIILSIYNKLEKEENPNRFPVETTPKRMKNLVNGSMMTSKNLGEEEDSSALDTDDDVSLNKVGVLNCTNSSNETFNNLNSSFVNGRTSLSPDLWTKTKFNSTFCSNSILSRSPSIASSQIFSKPTSDSFRNTCKDDSDSDLDDGISCLNIGSRKPSSNTNSVFSLRSFTPMPRFIVPSEAPQCRPRPLIMPSKLGHNTSWVAGGYWGGDENRQIFNVNGSRSSSQSSGFESQTSSGTARNPFSQPSSREESICGDNDRTLCSNRFMNGSVSNYNTQSLFHGPQNFNPTNNLVYPKMNSDNHIHIPQARYYNSHRPHSICSGSSNHFANDSSWMFKRPGQSGLIKLPQDN